MTDYQMQEAAPLGVPKVGAQRYLALSIELILLLSSPLSLQRNIESHFAFCIDDGR